MAAFDRVAQLPCSPTVETVEMALEIADSAARSDVEIYGNHVQIGNRAWYDLQGLDEEFRKVVEFSLRYMAARGDALPYRVVCHPNYPYLRRFEERPHVVERD